MKNFHFFTLLLIIFLGLEFYFSSCQREPVYIGELIGTPVDTSGQIDTTGGDTTIIIPPPPIDSVDLTGTPCSPDSVYFINQIQPLVNSQCALSGCHDAITHKDGIDLSSYQKIRTTGKVTPFNASNSKFYKSLIDNDPGDRMPPPPAAPLTTEQKAMVFKWINQGALNNQCNENYGQGCDTTNVTYTNFVQPLVANNCLGCHSSASTGGNILLKTYDQVKTSVQTTQFYNSVAWLGTASHMPKNLPQLSPCFVDKVKAWIDAGMPQ